MIGRLTDIEIMSLLKNNSVGRIGCTDGMKPYVVPVTYAYDGTYIIAHSSPGLKLDIMKKNPLVCFQVDEISTFSNWKSAIAWGKFEVIENVEEKRKLMRFFIQSVMHISISETANIVDMPVKSDHPHSPEDKNIVVYRIRVEEMSGRFEKK